MQDHMCAKEAKDKVKLLTFNTNFVRLYALMPFYFLISENNAIFIDFLKDHDVDGITG